MKRRQALAVLGVFLLIAGLTVATLTGTRERAAALQLLRGDAWLANQVTGTVTTSTVTPSGPILRCR